MRKYLEKQDVFIDYDFCPSEKTDDLQDGDLCEHSAFVKTISFFHEVVANGEVRFIKIFVDPNHISAIQEAMTEIESLKETRPFDGLPF